MKNNVPLPSNILIRSEKKKNCQERPTRKDEMEKKHSNYHITNKTRQLYIFNYIVKRYNRKTIQTLI